MSTKRILAVLGLAVAFLALGAFSSQALDDTDALGICRLYNTSPNHCAVNPVLRRIDITVPALSGDEFYAQAAGNMLRDLACQGIQKALKGQTFEAGWIVNFKTPGGFTVITCPLSDG
jgi:hypothetical protein